MSATSNTSQLVCERDAAALLCVSPYLLQKWRWKNEGPSWIRVGGQNGRAVRYRLVDLENYIRQNTVISGDRSDPINGADK